MAGIRFDKEQESEPEHFQADGTGIDRYYSLYHQHQLWSKQTVARLAERSSTTSNQQFFPSVLRKARFGLR